MGKNRIVKRQKKKQALMQSYARYKKYVPELFDLFKATADPRILGFITYTNLMMPG